MGFSVQKFFLFSIVAETLSMSNRHCRQSARALFLFGICALLVLQIGCGTKQGELTNTETAERDATLVGDEVLKSLRSSHVTDLIQFNDDDFNKGLLNDVDRANRYLKNNNKGVQAANLGIYLSDLSCLVAHDKREQANRYFHATLTLAESIGLKKQFGSAVQLHFNELLAGDSTLQKSLDTKLKGATNTADEGEIQKLHAAALMGYYIEELHLLASFIKSRHENQDSVFFATLGVFASQRDELGNLIKYFDHMQFKSEGISVYQELLLLQEKYWLMDTDRFWSLQETNPEMVLKDQTLQDVFEVLSSIRKRIIDS